MATSRPSDSNGAASNDPARPSDHIDQDAPAVESGGDGIVQPRLGVVGYLRFEASPAQFQIASVCSIVLGFYCLALPHTPPGGASGT